MEYTLNGVGPNGVDQCGQDNEGDTKPQTQMQEIRLLIENSHVGAIIGKGGANCKRIREETGAFISILKSDFRNVQERVMLLKGDLDSIGKAIAMSSSFVNDASSQKTGLEPSETTVKLLVHRFAVGAVIGKQGAVIKQTQTDTGCRIQISQEPMPNSTDKTVTVTGSPEACNAAVITVLKQLDENPLRPGVKEFPYTPGAMGMGMGGMGMGMQNSIGGGYGGVGMGGNVGGGNHMQGGPPNQYGGPPGGGPQGMYQGGPSSQNSQFGMPQNGMPTIGMASTSTQKIAIPTVTAGCVIGKSGATIKDIRIQSGTSVSIADPDPATPEERVVTISGSAQGIQTAIYLIRNLVEHFQPPQF